MGNDARCREAQDLSGLSRAAANGRTEEVERYWLSLEGLTADTAASIPRGRGQRPASGGLQFFLFPD
jgi:hypothetical protein